MASSKLIHERTEIMRESDRDGRFVFRVRYWEDTADDGTFTRRYEYGGFPHWKRVEEGGILGFSPRDMHAVYLNGMEWQSLREATSDDDQRDRLSLKHLQTHLNELFSEEK